MDLLQIQLWIGSGAEDVKVCLYDLRDDGITTRFW